MIERARDHACSDPQGFSSGIAGIVNEAVGNHLQLGKIRVGFLIQKVLRFCLQYQVKLESNFAAILLAIGVLEGVGRSLDPELDILTASTPFILKSQLLNSKKWKEEERLEREAAAAAAAAAAAVAAGAEK
jgi:aarF domain-containing kinase